MSQQTSIRFGDIGECDPYSPEAYPFIYTLVDPATDYTLVGGVRVRNFYSTTPAIRNRYFGVQIGADSMEERTIILEPDYNYFIERIAFTAMTDADPAVNPYEWYTDVGSMFTYFDMNTQYANPILKDVSATMIVKSSQSVFIYGGSNINGFQNGDEATIPLDVTSIQGYDYKPDSERTEYFVSKNGQLTFQLHNESTVNDIIVNAAIFGQKVRV